MTIFCAKEAGTVKLIATCPVEADAVKPYCGQPVLAQTIHGDVVVGVLDRVADGIVWLKPLGLPEASVRSLSQTNRKNGKAPGRRKNGKPGRVVILNGEKPKKAATSLFGVPGFGPFGFGYGPFGYRAGWALALPLFVLLALFTLPFI